MIQSSGEFRREDAEVCLASVVARSAATRQSRVVRVALDCFAEPIIGPRLARTRWLAMTARLLFEN